MNTYNPTEHDERAYLREVISLLRTTLQVITDRITQYAKEIREQKAYLWENKTGMDHVEKISLRQSVDQQVLTAESVKDKSNRIRKLLPSPYFGRVDFIRPDDDQPQPIYIGLHGFVDENKGVILIHDWRAPVSTLFYDYEKGAASFESPDGTVKGEITLKRQYRIRRGDMEFMLQSDINIHDDVLQKELSCASDERLKNIVATIQRDQNAIIRNEDSEVLIIQGVAGSGKTSIALHRMAFMLYRFKETIRAKDLLIISPNKVFADYISNILPELGEENIPEIHMEKLANDLLAYEYKFQTFFDQVSTLLKKHDPAYAQRIRFKASLAFLEKLDAYIDYVESQYFQAEDFTVNGRLVPAWFMQEKFPAYTHMPIIDRLKKLAKDIEMNIGIHYHYDLSPEDRVEVKNALRKMFKIPTLRALYKDFYSWLKKPDMLKPLRNGTYEWADVFPLIYLKISLEGVPAFGDVRHLLIDEMQDYTPIQYKVLSELFPCHKTILGDANQSVNPLSSSSAEVIQQVFPSADAVKLTKSYRSTFEITAFAQKISP
ncbi:MAG: AAA family ATPase, partial [Candidatus Omnitrophica bacterium]|nr:AAA family ATPase [Candidatus Omnitrophota bacterium]